MLAPVLVFLVRHAHSDPGAPDELRPLSGRGVQEAHDLAARLAEHQTPPALVVTSPLRRARETAEAIAQATDAELRMDDALAPGASAGSLRDAIGDENGPVACVGHQPDCSEIVLELTGRDPGFATAGVFELDLD